MQSIQFKRTNVSGKKPTPEQLQVGEVAINLKDHVIFTKDRDHEVVQISVSPETHAALESKVDANKQELDSTIAVNDRNIHAKVDEIKQTTDSTIAANHAEINNKVDVIKRETDATIEANKNKAASDLAGVKAELSDTINANKNAAAVATQELDTRINKKVDDIKSRTDATIASNDKAINDKVDLIKAETDRTIAANKVYAENQLTDTYNNLTGVIAANKQEAADNVAALTRDVEAKNTAIHSKVDNNKSYTDSELARLESRIDAADGSSDGKYIKKHVNTYTDGYLLSKTANYFDDPNARNLDYFGAFRMNDLAGHLALALHVPHPSGLNHSRGFDFTYGSNVVPTVKTYGYDELGHLAYSHRMYHEGDKPTPAEIGAYSKAEIDRMFQKTIDFGSESGWFKIATVYLPQNYGRSAKIRLVGGNGWNVGQTGQCNIIELVLRTGNDSPKGINIVAYHHISGYDNLFCAINTSNDNYDIYAYYSQHTSLVLVEYQASSDVNLTVLDRPEYVGEKPVAEHIFDAYTIRSFNSFSNRGTLNFAGNHQGQYDIEHLNEQQTNSKKMLRRFRSSAPATIWHETVDDNAYRLATGYEDTNQELLLTATTGLHVKRLTLDGGAAGGNAGIDIRRGPNESSHFNFMDYRTGQDVRNGWFGFGDLTTKDFIWWNDNGQNSINLIEDGELHITGGKGQKIVMNSEVALSENARLAVKGGNYGLMLRNDGSSFHILTTDLKDSFGSWNNRRPFSYDFADGGLYLGGTETARCLHLGIDGSTRLEDNLFFKAGSRQSMDYMELVHWGASNVGRNNVLSLRDSKGFLAEFERKGDNTIQNTFFGRFKVNGDSNAITVNAPTDSDAVYVKGTCNDVDNWYIGKGGAGNGLVFCSYRSNAAVHLTDNGEVLLAPQNTAIVNVNRDRIHINGTQWVANQPHGWGNQWLSEAPIFVDFGTGVPNDTYMPIIKARSQIAGGYATKADFGIYRHGAVDTWGDAVIRVGSAESGDSSHPNAIYTFRANGDFKAPAGLRAGVNLGVGTDPVLGGHSIAIGDNDTGLVWGGDGRINMFANGQHIASWGVFHQEHPGLWSVGAGLWTEVDKAIISHGHLIQANDSYSTYVRDIYIRSDIRVKKDLVKFENASQTLSKINGYKYLQKRGTNEDGSERWEENAGLIAQEVQAILPELVEGDPDSENLLRLNYNGVVGLNTAAINEHTEEIALLKEENNRLKEENKILHDRLAAIEAKLFG
ncbi:tail fiber domain-containing protein [Escherichia coli]|nr:tail fiber domain-containing protein [Escherichia coli]